MDPIARLRPHCTAVGFDLDTAGWTLLERLRLAAEGGGSKTFDDALRMASYAQKVFRYCEESNPSKPYSASEKQTVILAALFSDIGKTGPAEANAETRRYVVDVFAVENVRDDQQPLGAFLRTYFPADAERRLASFEALGLKSDMSIRDFWNLHSQWTLGILENAGIPPEAVAAAATHHLLDNVNPGSIVGEDDRFTRYFGNNDTFDRTEKLVIVLDKYDASRRRGHLDHAAAIQWLKDKIAKNQRYYDDEELLDIVSVVSKALA